MSKTIQDEYTEALNRICHIIDDAMKFDNTLEPTMLHISDTEELQSMMMWIYLHFAI